MAPLSKFHKENVFKTIIPWARVANKMIDSQRGASLAITNLTCNKREWTIIVLLNLMSFLKPSKLENYTQILVQFHFSFIKWPEVKTVYKEKIKRNARLLQRQLNENLNAIKASVSVEQSLQPSQFQRKSVKWKTVSNLESRVIIQPPC